MEGIFLFIVNYEDGKTISEAEMPWDKLPKDGIAAIQLKWDFYDFVKVLSDRMDQFCLMFDGGVTFRADIGKELKQFSEYRGQSNIVKTVISRDVIERAKDVIRHVETDLDRYYLLIKELNEKRKTKLLSAEEQTKYQHLMELIGRAEGNRSFLNMIILDMEAFAVSDDKVITLIGSSKHKYAFWQDKVAYFNLNSATDLGAFDQRVGMVIDSTGRTVVCEMNLRTGHFKTYVTTVDSLKLNLQVFSNIELSKIE